jgi:hypothetical protein
VTEETWRPLGVETDEDVAEYDALHAGVPDWMWSAYWQWVQTTLIRRAYPTTSRASRETVAALKVDMAESMCQTLRIPLPNLRVPFMDYSRGKEQLTKAVNVLAQHKAPLQIADYLLAHDDDADAKKLDELLTRAKSAFTIGKRAGRPALVPRVPVGVQDAADSVMARAGRAGVRLAKAWEALYGLEPDPGAAYGLAIKAIEDAAIPVVSSGNARATLGTVLAQIEQQADWKLPMDREDDRAASGATIVAMMRLVWVGQHDRHAGQPFAPGDVSIEEATVAVSLAVTLVNLFAAGLPAR